MNEKHFAKCSNWWFLRVCDYEGSKFWIFMRILSKSNRKWILDLARWSEPKVCPRIWSLQAANWDGFEPRPKSAQVYSTTNQVTEEFYGNFE